MKLEKWALVAEIVSGVAVILTLIFLIIEVRENTNATLAANRQTVITDLREGLLVRAQSPSLAAALEAAASGAELTPTQKSQYRAYLYQVIKSAEGAFAQYIEGQLDREYLDTRLAGLMIPDFLGNDLGRSHYERFKTSGQLTSEFSEEVDTKLAATNHD